MLIVYIALDQLPAGDIQVCLGSNETSDYTLVNITLQVQYNYLNVFISCLRQTSKRFAGI